ncbi:MAG: methyl-accepting chemotaxis protein, partial [Schwartzia sp.]|nr:methyl-accepting chemotaxis protein [Schwartzia sp. (in: firmicutes)]
MSLLNNIKVFGKIMILVIIAAIGMASIGYRGYSTIMESKKGMATIYNQSLQQVQEIGETKYLMRDMQSRAILAMIAKTPERHADLANDADQIQKNFEKHWAIFEKASEGQANAAEKSASVRKAWDTFYKTMRDIMKLCAENRLPEAEQLYSSKGGTITQDLRKPLEALQKEAQDTARAIDEETESNAASAATMMIMMSAACLIVLLLVGMGIAKAITSPLEVMMETCDRLKDGDFRKTPMNIDRGDEFGTMAGVVTSMRDGLNALMVQTHDSSEQIAAASEELTASAGQSAEASNQVAQSVTDAASEVVEQQSGVSTSIEAVGQVAQSVDAIRRKADTVAQRSEAAAEHAGAGSEAIRESVGQIRSVESTVQASSAMVDKLGERSQEIGQIVETISGIADQTNLLALNAAIEAARAGEHGRGFAVVAEEVRKLAEQSGQAAHQISDLIRSIQDDTKAAVDSMQL